MTDETPNPPRRSRKRTHEALDVAPSAEVLAVDHEGAPEPAPKPGPEPGPEPEPLTSAPSPAVGISSLRLERGGIAEATADSVEIRMGGIGALDADEVFVQWGGIGAARAQRVGVEFGSVGAAMAGEIRLTQGYAGSVVAREATIEQGIVRTLVAQRVHIARPSAVLVMIAQHVSGEVRPLLDWRGALAFGAAFGLVSGLLKLVRRRS